MARDREEREGEKEREGREKKERETKDREQGVGAACTTRAVKTRSHREGPGDTELGRRSQDAYTGKWAGTTPSRFCSFPNPGC